MTSWVVNIEKLVSRVVREDAAMQAFLGDRFYTSLPSGVVFPCGRITRLGGSPDRLPPLDRPWVQLDFWGGPKDVAWSAASEAMTLLTERLPGRHVEGFVYGGIAVQLSMLRYLPDSTYDPAKPRYTFDAYLLTRL